MLLLCFFFNYQCSAISSACSSSVRYLDIRHCQDTPRQLISHCQSIKFISSIYGHRYQEDERMNGTCCKVLLFVKVVTVVVTKGLKHLTVWLVKC